MDKTYAETKGKAPFDWNAFLIRAEQGQITNDERMNAYDFAACWVTCACGNQCAIIPRGAEVEVDDLTDYYDDAPTDEMLCGLGMEFFHMIEAWNWPGARETLKQIELRSKELIAIELAKLNSCSTSST